MFGFLHKCIQSVRTSLEHAVTRITAFFNTILQVPESTALHQLPEPKAVPILTVDRPVVAVEKRTTCRLRTLQVLPIVPTSSKGFESNEAKKTMRGAVSRKTSVPISFPSVAERVREWEAKVTPYGTKSSHINGKKSHRLSTTTHQAYYQFL